MDHQDWDDENRRQDAYRRMERRRKHVAGIPRPRNTASGPVSTDVRHKRTKGLPAEVGAAWAEGKRVWRIAAPGWGTYTAGADRVDVLLAHVLARAVSTHTEASLPDLFDAVEIVENATTFKIVVIGTYRLSRDKGLGYVRRS
jgi:hypothetical protein